MVFVRKYLPELAGSLIGGLGGFLYWKYVGCVSGTCPIKSHWYMMVPWGIIMGYLIGSLIKDISGRFTARKGKEEM